MKKILLVILALSLTAFAACAPSQGGESSAPSAESSEPSAESSAPSAESSEPSAESSAPSAESSEPSAESSEPSAEPEILDGSRLVVFGDSITALGTWGRTVAEELNMYFFNGAMGGITSAQGLERFSAYVAAKDPDFVTLLFGMNDLIMTKANTPRISPEQFGENLKELIAKTRECGAVPILLTTNPLNPNTFFSAQGQDKSWYSAVGTPLEWLDVYNAVTRSVAAETDTKLIDLRAACEGVPYTQLLSDGIHLAKKGNEIFVEEITDWFKNNYTSDPNAERVSDEDTYVYAADSESPLSLVSFDPNAWYTVTKSEMRFVSLSDGGVGICNTTGKWPESHCLPEAPVCVSVANGELTFDIDVNGAGASFVLYFDGATPSAFTDGQYAVINKALGGKTESYTGDLLPNQKLKGSVKLSELGIPASVIHDGNVLITGLKLFVAGTANQYVKIRDLSVSE